MTPIETSAKKTLSYLPKAAISELRNYLHYEQNQREPPLILLAQFAAFFEVSVDYLLGLTDEL